MVWWNHTSITLDSHICRWLPFLVCLDRYSTLCRSGKVCCHRARQGHPKCIRFPDKCIQPDIPSCTEYFCGIFLCSTLCLVGIWYCSTYRHTSYLGRYIRLDISPFYMQSFEVFLAFWLRLQQLEGLEMVKCPLLERCRLPAGSLFLTNLTALALLVEVVQWVFLARAQLPAGPVFLTNLTGLDLQFEVQPQQVLQ